MSAVFYGWKIPREDLWDVVRQLRRLAHPRSIYDFEGIIKSGKLSYEQAVSEIAIDIQVFPFDEESYVFRILESGHELMSRMPKDIELFAYDDRSDTLKNPCSLEDVEQIDELIVEGIYFMISIRSAI